MAVKLAARDSYGTLVAWLTTRCNDLALAEDAMGDALEVPFGNGPSTACPAIPRPGSSPGVKVKGATK